MKFIQVKQVGGPTQWVNIDHIIRIEQPQTRGVGCCIVVTPALAIEVVETFAEVLIRIKE